jgi:hypothetical protein
MLACIKLKNVLDAVIISNRLPFAVSDEQMLQHPAGAGGAMVTG